MAKTSKTTQKYRKIDYETRLRLIDLVVYQKKAVSTVSTQYQISDSTVRSIIKAYLEKNTIFETKQNKMKRVILQELR